MCAEPTEVPRPEASGVQLGFKEVLHILRGQPSDLGPILLSLNCSQNLGLERLGPGVGLVGVPREGRVWCDGGGSRKPNPPQGLSQGSYLTAACILDPTLALTSAPSC